MSNQEVDLKPVSMFAITAKLIHHLVQSVQDRFGEEGHELVKKGITHFIDEQKELVEKGSKPYELQEKEIFSYEKLLDPEKVEQTYKNYIHAQEQAGREFQFTESWQKCLRISQKPLWMNTGNRGKKRLKMVSAHLERNAGVTLPNARLL